MISDLIWPLTQQIPEVFIPVNTKKFLESQFLFENWTSFTDLFLFVLSETEISSSYFDPRYLTTLCNFTKLSMKALTICGFSDSLLKKPVTYHIATSSINSSSILRDLSIILQFSIIDILTRERSLYPNHHQMLASWSYFYPLCLLHDNRFSINILLSLHGYFDTSDILLSML